MKNDLLKRIVTEAGNEAISDILGSRENKSATKNISRQEKWENNKRYRNVNALASIVDENGYARTDGLITAPENMRYMRQSEYNKYTDGYLILDVDNEEYIEKMLHYVDHVELIDQVYSNNISYIHESERMPGILPPPLVSAKTLKKAQGVVFEFTYKGVNFYHILNPLDGEVTGEIYICLQLGKPYRFFKICEYLYAGKRIRYDYSMSDFLKFGAFYEEILENGKELGKYAIDIGYNVSKIGCVIGGPRNTFLYGAAMLNRILYNAGSELVTKISNNIGHTYIASKISLDLLYYLYCKENIYSGKYNEYPCTGLTPEVKARISLDKFNNFDELDIGEEVLSVRYDYLKLLQKVAENGSSTVVPRKPMMSFEEFASKYFIKTSNGYSVNLENLDREHNADDPFSFSVAEAIETMNLIECGEAGMGYDLGRVSHVRLLEKSEESLKKLYWSKVWNNLYFKPNAVWKEIAFVNDSGRNKYVIEYDEIYNEITVNHYFLKSDGELFLAFSGSIDIDDIAIAMRNDNYAIKSLRATTRSKILYDSIVKIYYKIGVGSGTNKLLKVFDEHLKDGDTSLEIDKFLDSLSEYLNASDCIELNLLFSHQYSLFDVMSLMSSKTEEELYKNYVVMAGEDYTTVLLNYLIISVLSTQQEYIAEAVSQIQQEIRESKGLGLSDADLDELQELINEITKSRRGKKVVNTKILDKTSKNGHHVYVFNNVRAYAISDILSKKVEHKRKTCKYTTPYWVRRGHYKTSRNGERVWIPEQICCRSAELLGIEYKDVEDLKEKAKKESTVYKATNLFK